MPTMRLLLTSFIFSILIANWIGSQDVETECPQTTCQESQTRIQTGSHILPPHCRCDNQCGDYGDCCINAPNKTKTSNESLYSCTPIPYNDGYFLRRTCSNVHAKNQSKCAASTNYTQHIYQMQLKLPVTSLQNNVTYGNLFCAFCNNVTNFTFWELKVECGSWKTEINTTKRGTDLVYDNRPDLRDTLKFENKTLKLWQYYKNGKAIANCTMKLAVPSTLRQMVRQCKPSLKATCPSDYPITNVTKRCTEYQSIVYNTNGGDDFKNAYCALCNNIPLKNLSCYEGPKSVIRVTPFSLRPRNTPRLFPAPFRRQLTVAQEIRRKNRSYVYIAVKSDCESFLGGVAFTKVKAETVAYKTMNRTFIRNTTTVSGTQVQICTVGNMAANEVRQQSKLNATFFRLVVSVGCLTVCTFLLLYTWNWLASDEPKQNYQKLMLCFAGAMLLVNVAFFYESISNEELNGDCMVGVLNNVLSYYGFLSSYLWISAMAFDISCCVWGLAFNQSSLLNDNAFILLVVYSSISWILPAVIALAMVTYRHPDESFEYTCFVSTSAYFLWFYSFPQTVIMAVNLAFYLCTVFVVFTYDGIIDKMLETGIEFKLHTSLITLTNVMWLIIILAGYFDKHSLIVLFILCDIILSLTLFMSSLKKGDKLKPNMTFTNNYSVTMSESIKQ